MRTNTLSVPRTHTPRKPWSGLGVRVNESVERFAPHSPAWAVELSLWWFGGEAPVHDLLRDLVRLGTYDPEHMLLHAVAQSERAFSFYRLGNRS